VLRRLGSVLSFYPERVDEIAEQLDNTGNRAYCRVS
jgi:hypothetical protein